MHILLCTVSATVLSPCVPLRCSANCVVYLQKLTDVLMIPHMCSLSRSHLMQWTLCHSLPQNRTFQLWLPGGQARPYASSVTPSNVTLPNFAYFACLQALCRKVKEAIQHIKWCLLAMLQSQGPSELFHIGPATHAKLVHNDVGATCTSVSQVAVPLLPRGQLPRVLNA